MTQGAGDSAVSNCFAELDKHIGVRARPALLGSQALAPRTEDDAPDGVRLVSSRMCSERATVAAGAAACSERRAAQPTADDAPPCDGEAPICSETRGVRPNAGDAPRAPHRHGVFATARFTTSARHCVSRF